MAHFYGMVYGAKSATTRVGTKQSGIRAVAQGDHLGIEAEMIVRDGIDVAIVKLTGGRYPAFEPVIIWGSEEDTPDHALNADAFCQAIYKMEQALHRDKEEMDEQIGRMDKLQFENYELKKENQKLKDSLDSMQEQYNALYESKMEATK